MYDMDIDDVDTSSESEEKISSDEDTPLLEEAMEPQKENLDAAVKEEVSDDTVNMGAVILAPVEAGMNVEENAILPGGLVVQDDGFDESQRNEEEDMAQTSKAMDVDNTVDMAQEEVVPENAPEQMAMASEASRTVDEEDLLHSPRETDMRIAGQGVHEEISVGINPEQMEMGPEESRRVDEEDVVQSRQAKDMGNTLDGFHEEVGPKMTSNPDQTGATKTDPDRLIIHIPKRQRVDDSEYVEDEDHGKESIGHRVIAKKARTSSSALPRVKTWSLEAIKAQEANDGSEYADDDGEEEMDESPVKVKRTRRTSSGRHRIVSNATVAAEDMDPTLHPGGTVTAEEDIPPALTSDGWETYETDDHCYSCDRVGIRCFRFRQHDKGRKRWSCFRCHKRKKQCSFNDGKSWRKASKPLQHRRKSEGTGKSMELEDEGDDTNETGDTGTAGKENEREKAPQKKKGKDKQNAQERKTGKDQEKKRRRSSTKPGKKSKQKQKASTPAELDRKPKKEEEDVEWQTSMFISHFFFSSLSNWNSVRQ
jgi:hypothetical protein